MPRYRPCIDCAALVPGLAASRCPTCQTRYAAKRAPTGPAYRGTWTQVARRAKERDGYRCRVCGVHYRALKAQGQRLSVHHRRAVRDGGTDDLANLVTLCPRHHVEAEAVGR